MPGLTSSMNIGLTGLRASQSALNVIGHNIANINTPGYSRQRVNLQTGIPEAFGNLRFGSGVGFASIMSVRDRFLDLQITQSIGRQHGSNARYEGVQGVSAFFTETGEGGLNLQIQRFFEGFQELSLRPEDLTVRTNLVARAQSMITGMQSRYQMIQQGRSKEDATVVGLTEEVNTLTSQIAELNKRIAQEPTPGSENDARDQRKALLDKLAEKVGITVYEDSLGQSMVSLDSGAAVLVSGATAYKMETVPDPLNNAFSRVYVTLSGSLPIDVTDQIQDGRMGAALDLRDRVLLGYQRQLDQLGAGIVQNVNQVHRAGFSLSGATGNDFFLANVGNNGLGLPVTVSAANNYQGMVSAMAINGAIAANPGLVAAASVAGAPGNNTQATAMASLYNALNTVDTNGDGVGDSGPFSTVFGNLANTIGVDVQRFSVTGQTAENLVVALQNQRDRISGVDLDEEATTLIAYQRGYQASSRFINVINQLTDQLVNQFGR